MSEVKWIKIMVTLFDNKKIKRMETLTNGSALIVIWVHLLCLAGSINDEGLVYFTREIPYTHQTLAAQLRQPLSLVRQALKVFAQFGMIAQSDGNIRIVNWHKYQNTEGLDKIKEQNRQRNIKYRQNKKSVSENDVTVTSRDAAEEDLEKDLEKEGVLAVKPHPAKKRFVPPTLEEVTAYCRERKNHVNPVKFIAHYDTRGWMAGKTKMRSWQSAVITWENNEFDKGSGETEEIIWAMDRKIVEDEEINWAMDRKTVGIKEVNWAMGK